MNWIYYSLAPSQSPFHQKLLECLSCCFSEVPEIQADQARARQVRDSGGCCPEEEKPQKQSPRKKQKGDTEDGCCPM